MAPTKTGAIRQQIGPMKANLIKHQQNAEDLLSQVVPQDTDSLRESIQDLQFALRNLTRTYRKLQEKHDEWVLLVRDLPDEQCHYDDACQEIIQILLDCDDVAARLEDQIGRRETKVNSINSSTVTVPQANSPATAVVASDQTSVVQNSGLQVASGQSSTLPTQTTANAVSMNAAPQHSAFKAAKMNLPKFSGDYMQFKQFWGIFEANVHNRTDFTNIEKFSYLLAQLEGDAKEVLTCIRVTEDSYPTAVKLLKTRFDRADDRLVTMLYSKFMKLQQCSRQIADKQRTLDSCERVFMQLESAGEDINSNRSLVVGLLSKFPSGMVRDLQRYYNVGPNNRLNEVREGLGASILEEETTSGMLDDIQSIRASSQREVSDSGKQPQQKQITQSGPAQQYYDQGASVNSLNTSALASVTANRQRGSSGRPQGGGFQLMEPPSNCIFCRGYHFNDKCTVFPSASSRLQQLADLNRCTRCTKPLKYHDQYGNCHVPIKCVHCRTDQDHASVLCSTEHPDPSAVTPTPPPAAPKPNGDSNQSASGFGELTALSADVKPTLFQTAKTTAINPVTGQQFSVRLAMDTLSGRSYIKMSVAQKLGLIGEHSQKLYVSVFGSNKTVEIPTTRVEFNVVLRDGTQFQLEANTTNVICQSGVVHNRWTDEERKALAHFTPALADDPYDPDGTIDVLIGSALVWEFIEGPRIATPAPGLYLIPSKLGLMLAGESCHEASSKEPTMLCITESPCQFPSSLGLVACETRLEPHYPDIDEFWDLERIGITDDPTENDDDKALEKFQRTVKFENGRYQVTLPWIEEKKDLLPTNYEVAYDRLRGLTKRLRVNKDLLQGYRDILTLQMHRGIIEEVPSSEFTTDNVTHYLPHHAVIKSSSNTTKVRIVYDAGSKKAKKQLSLNECLFRGPVILPDLCQMLMRMRTHETVIISDIEKAFLQVSLQPQERDSTRFLWFKDDTNLTLKDNIAVFRFTRVNFGVISSPFLLAATIDHHLSQEQSEFAESLRNDIYVDNVISGLDGEMDPLAYYLELKALFERAGMNIQEFCSNSTELMNSIPEHDRVNQKDVKVLGLKWDSQNDDSLRLAPSSKFNGTSGGSTKRAVLQAVAAVFDPLGFYQPVLLPAKCFLQKLWDLKYDWNDSFDGELKGEWESLRGCLTQIFEHRIPRFIGRVDPHTTIAVFCDASARAYAASVYLRLQQADGSYVCRLIFAKSRLAPTAKKRKRTGTQVTLPRLELLGTLIGVRAATFCRGGLRIPQGRIDVFTDSQCVLHWINSRGLLKRFVANRVEEIRKATNCTFHYVSTTENPADLSTRGKLPDELFSDELWWNGPPWLTQDPSTWPKSSVPPMTAEAINELRSEIQPVYFGHTLAAPDAEPEEIKVLSMDLGDVSSLLGSMRVSAICFKFLKVKLWNKLSQQTKDSKPMLKQLFDNVDDSASITADDYENAVLQWVKVVQANNYSDVLEALSDEQNLLPDNKPPIIIFQLGLQLDERGLIRAHGRYEHADLPAVTRSPYLLPKDDRFTALLVADVHQRNMHVGVSHTLCLLRQKYWIPHGRAIVRSVLSKCLICRRYKTAMPFKLPPMPPWPQERVQQSAPFQTTGLDYFGPITVKLSAGQIKMWVCLFTCLVTRAVHLEPVMDFTAQEFLHCFIRFVSRRGVPSKIISDNAAQFQLVKILGDQAWKRTPTDESVTAYAANHSINWKFITELAPWQGGFYERLVGLVKSTLRTSIRQKLLTWTDLVTLLAESEAVVNSRPMTYINDDINSRFRVLRPVDFLVVQTTSLTDSPDGADVRFSDFGDAGRRLVSIWKQRCRTLEKLWKYWYEEYLLSLRERRIVSHKTGRSDVSKLPLLDQVVLITEAGIPRGRWKLARITKLPTSSDGQIRTAELLLPNGFHIRRALNQLVPLEVAPHHAQPTNQQNSDPGTSTRDRDSTPAISTGPDPDPDPGPSAHIPLPPDSPTEDDVDFFGFSQSDIQRTVDALQRFDHHDRDDSSSV